MTPATPATHVTIDGRLAQRLEVHTILTRLKMRSPHEVAGMAAAVWGQLQLFAERGVAGTADLAAVDRIAGRKGFGRAMAEVGWLSVSESGEVSVPAFSAYHGPAYREREASAERMRRTRTSAATAAEHGAQHEPNIDRNADRTTTATPTEHRPQHDRNGGVRGGLDSDLDFSPDSDLNPQNPPTPRRPSDERETPPAPPRFEPKPPRQPPRLAFDALTGDIPAGIDSPELRAAMAAYIAVRKARKHWPCHAEWAGPVLADIARWPRATPALAAFAVRKATLAQWQSVNQPSAADWDYDADAPRDKTRPAAGRAPDRTPVTDTDVDRIFEEHRRARTPAAV